jgi:hypothetical protein
MRRCRRYHHVFVGVTGVVVACVALIGGPFAARAAAQEPGVAGNWTPPVPGRVVRPFAEPIARYAAGHRGVDFAATAGVSVRAANDGTVSFAGDVAGSLHVVVAHDGGIRTSYSFLTRVDVRVGQLVRRGQVVGAAGGVGDGHGAGVLHFGVRIGDRYVDPMVLFHPRDLTQLVRLVPAGERDPGGRLDPEGERAALLAWMSAPDGDSSCGGVVGGAAEALGLGDEASSLCDVLGAAVEAGLDALRSLGSEAAHLADAIEPLVKEVIRRMEDLGESLAEAAEAVAGEAADQVERAVRALVALGIRTYEQLTSCPQPDPIANPAGSGNLVMAVAGQGSLRRRRPDGSVAGSFHFEHKVLGYRRGDVSYFSYEASSATYEKAATYGDLHAKARLLGEQIEAAARAQPGRHIDLVGHSQGGVVIDLFVMEVYRGHESEYPPIDNVVTFASPHEGTPAANVAAAAADSPFGPVVEPIVDDEAQIPLGAPAFEQISLGSPMMHKLWSAQGPPRTIRYLSIVGSLDPAVPSAVGDVPGATKIVVPVGSAFSPLDDHSGILRDSDALSAAQAQLSGGAPVASCGPLTDVVGTSYVVAEQAAAEMVSSIQPSGMPSPAPLPASSILGPEGLP